MATYLPIGEVCVELNSDSDVIMAEWHRLFGGWLSAVPAYPVVMRLNVAYVEELPARPEGDPVFIDNRVMNADTGNGLLDAYKLENDDMVLYFPDGGYVDLVWQTDDEIPTATGLITQTLMTYQFLDDYTTVAISPILRQHQYYFIHSSGVSYNGHGLLFVGQSKSGKTTTCLNLVTHGWKLLSNDVVILHPKEDGIYAYALPDLLTIRPKTVDILPSLKPFLASEHAQRVGNEVMLSSWEVFNDRWSEPVRVHAVCFPQVDDRVDSELMPQMGAMTLARLLETSLDCWDTDTLDEHTSLMVQLTEQSPGYILSLGRDIDALPSTLIEQLSLH